MKQRLIEQVGRSARLKLMNELKRTQGLCVGDLATRLEMSYMGVKGICLDLQKRGLLDTWRQPQKVGRPHMLYRLTARAHDLFPTESNLLTIDLLEAAQRLFGAAAAEKLLLVVFQKATERYLSRIKAGALPARAERFAKLRDEEGYMTQFVPGEGTNQIIEHHSPIMEVLRAFPIVARLETELFQRVLGVPVHREEKTASGLFQAVFKFG